MKKFLLILFCAWSFCSYAQSPKVTTHFYDKDDHLIDDESMSSYYTIDSVWEKESSSYSFYSASKRPRCVELRSPNDKPTFRTSYYESGRVQSAGAYKNGYPEGLIMAMYEDGSPMGQVEFLKNEGFNETRYKVLLYWDSLGNLIVNRGNGTGYIKFPPLKRYVEACTGTLVDGVKHGAWTGNQGRAVYEETYDNGKLIKGKSQRDGQTYDYILIEDVPAFKGGTAEMNTFISKNMKYSKAMRKQRIEGPVYTEFVINESGDVVDVKTIKGISANCDAEAARVIASMPPWKPGLSRGIPVKTRYVLPIRFYFR